MQRTQRSKPLHLHLLQSQGPLPKHHFRHIQSRVGKNRESGGNSQIKHPLVSLSTKLYLCKQWTIHSISGHKKYVPLLLCASNQLAHKHPCHVLHPVSGISRRQHHESPQSKKLSSISKFICMLLKSCTPILIDTLALKFWRMHALNLHAWAQGMDRAIDDTHMHAYSHANTWAQSTH
jgi:hypothetical protein